MTMKTNLLSSMKISLPPNSNPDQVLQPNPMRANEYESASYPTDPNYLKAPNEKFGFLSRMRKFLRMDSRGLLTSALVPDQLNHLEWKYYSSQLNSRTRTLARKEETVRKLADFALYGDIRALRKVIKLAYHSDVHEIASNIIPIIHARRPKLTRAACTEAMAKYDPVLEKMVLQERLKEVQSQLNSESTKSVSSGNYGKLRDSTEKKSRFAFSRSARLHNEEIEIKERLTQLEKAPKTPPILALIALSDGHDRRVTQAAHTVLRESRFCEKLGISSPEHALDGTREISKSEQLSWRKFHGRLPIQFKGSASKSQSEIEKVISDYKNKYRKSGRDDGNAWIYTIVDRKDTSDVKTLVLSKGQAVVVRISNTKDNDTVKMYKEKGGFVEMTIDNPFSSIFTKTSDKFNHDMFGLWTSVNLRSEPPNPMDLVHTSVKEWGKNNDFDREVKISRLRMLMINEVITGKPSKLHMW